MTRRNAHVAVIGNPDPGHIMPMLEVIHELVSRGHRVTVANEPAVAHLATVTGGEFVPVLRELPEAGGEWAEDALSAINVFLDGNMRALPQLKAAYDDDPADVYLYDTGSYVGRLLAESQGRPCAHLSPTIVTPRSDADAEPEPAPSTDAVREAEYQERFAKWLAENGAVTTDVGEFTGRAPRLVSLCAKVLQPRADDFDPERAAFVGPCLGGREAQGSWTRPDGAEKVLLISFGSSFTDQPEFYRQCLAAFGDLPGWHVVLVIGLKVDQADLGPIPANVEVHPWVPQLAVLEQADAFVTHAGTGGCAEALYHGVPMVAVPQGADHFSNTEQLVGLGVARHVPAADATAEALRDAVTAIVADPEVPARLARLREEVRSAGGAAQAADLIEGMLG
ncbi:glycosyltransferase [Streptomyces sp. DSM 42041]|uniref:Glycosyltransferase n=1 Tax=Streptomyces hazeniae TaxID=3075538 RepID=A0ABU2NL47_9ACTN|nr:macrolide family glycosyltransferase [Streptomyces sp. DSM 42041]MDT0377697.1 glycosyltransferase [Streptomyces sp. DSM 42041]